MATELDILDGFDRADSSSLGPNWILGTGYGLGGTNLAIVSNQAAKGSNTGYTFMCWNTTFGREQGCRLTVGTEPSDSVALMTRGANLGTGTRDAYNLTVAIGAPDGWKINRDDNDVSTQLGATVNQALAAGEKIQFESDGSTHRGFLYSGGTWTEIISRTDSTYLTGGYTGFYGTGADSSWRYNDFAGGPLLRPVANLAPRRSLGVARFELWLTTDTGQRLKQLSTGLGFDASKVVNGIGWLHYNPPKSFDKSLLKSDRMVQLWYTPRGATLGKLWNVYFIRKWKFRKKGVEYFAGPDMMELLRRRIVAAYTDSSQAKKTATAADNMIKAVVRESVLDTAEPTPTYGSRAWANLSVEADQTLGPQLSDSFPFKKLLTFEGGGVLPAIAKAAQVEGTEVFFWIVPNVVTKNSINFQFRTYINQPGQDVTGKVVFEEAANNLADASLEFDYSDEVNYVYATGQGEKDDREVQQVYDTTRINQSIWGRIEDEADSRDQDTPEGVNASGAAALWDGRPKRRFTGTPLDTPGTPFGIKWDVGYKVTTKFDVIQFDSIIRAVTLSVDSRGRKTIDTRLDYED